MHDFYCSIDGEDVDDVICQLEKIIELMREGYTSGLSWELDKLEE